MSKLNSNPLLWWKERSLKLSSLVLKLFSIPATSVPSERVFSSAKNVVTKKRNRMLSQTVDRLIFLYENQNVEHSRVVSESINSDV